MTELAIAPAALGSGVGAVVGELVDQAVVELPALAELAQREQLLAAAWLMSLRSVRTRRAYFGDLVAWLDFLRPREVDVLGAAAGARGSVGAGAAGRQRGAFQRVPAAVGDLQLLPVRRGA